MRKLNASTARKNISKHEDIKSYIKTDNEI